MTASIACENTRNLTIGKPRAMDVNLPIILIAALVAMASPGPATLALAGTAMANGRSAGLALASGIATGSLMWSVAAALGLGSVMLANAWVLEIVRYFGAAYLLFLALRAARSALSNRNLTAKSVSGSTAALFAKGLALHLTNPKAVLFFGSLYVLGLPPGTGVSELITIIAAVGLQSFLVFHGYALLFSSPVIAQLYLRLRRWFEAFFAVLFGAAGFKVLTTRLHEA